MPAIRHDDLLLRLLKRVEEISAALRRVTVNLPLYDVANENTPAQLTANQNNYVIGNYDILRLSANKTVRITGLRGGIKGRSLRIYNIGDNALLLPDQDAGSDAENRFKFPEGRIGYIGPGSSLELYYDSTAQKWISVAPVYDATPFFLLRHTTTVSKWIAVTYSEELGIFCAVSVSGGVSVYVATSPDGIVWTAQTGVPADWNDVTWSPELGLFVAVGANVVMSSPDGVTWTSQTPAANNNWDAIAWSPELGLFAAVSTTGTGNRVMTSPDGINWSIQSSAADNSWNDIVWSPELGLFAAVSTSGASRIMTSPDGIVWTSRVNASGGQAIAWSPELGLFVTQYYYSTDGIIWVSATGGNNFNGIAWSPLRGYFLGMTSSTLNPYVNSDGAIWNTALSTTLVVTDVTFSVTLNKFVAVSLNGNIYTFP